MSMHRWRPLAGALLLALLPVAAWSGGPVPVPPTVDTSGLPSLEGYAGKSNPYRGREEVVETGHTIFNQSCAVCHGADAVGNRSPAPDLRRLDGFCRRIEDEATRTHCLSDVDRYFAKTVIDGKIIVGTVHMPPWRGVLTPEQLWSIKTYLESRRP
jgi:mono/diheme cytochrome c family protein